MHGKSELQYGWMVPVASPLSQNNVSCQVWTCDYLFEVLDRAQLVLFLLKYTNILYLGGHVWMHEKEDNDDLW